MSEGLDGRRLLGRIDGLARRLPASQLRELAAAVAALPSEPTTKQAAAAAGVLPDPAGRDRAGKLLAEWRSHASDLPAAALSLALLAAGERTSTSTRSSARVRGSRRWFADGANADSGERR